MHPKLILFLFSQIQIMCLLTIKLSNASALHDYVAKVMLVLNITILGIKGEVLVNSNTGIFFIISVKLYFHILFSLFLCGYYSLSFGRSTPCPSVKHGDEWGEPSNCESGDSCQYCHTRTEQQFHPEIYKSTKCNDVQQAGYCPRGVFCAFAHVDRT